MSKTIRVIDLLNKIANGEEVPYKVKYNGIIFTYNSSNKQGLKYVDLNEENEVFYRYLTGVVNKLTDEVEIIEEQEEIEKMEVDSWLKANEIPNFIRNYIEHLEFENSALKTEHRFNIDKIEKYELKHKNLIERLEERKNKAREYMEEARKEKDKIRRNIMGRTFK